MIGEQICYAAVFLLESLIAWSYFEHLFSRRRRSIPCLLMYVLCYLLLYFLSLAGNMWINTGSFFVINTVLAYVLYLCNFKQAFLHSAFLTFLMCVGELLVMIIMSFWGNKYAAYHDTIGLLITYSALSKLFYFFFSSIASRRFRHDDIYNESGYLLLLAAVPLISCLIIILFAYIGSTVLITQSIQYLLAAAMLLLLLTNILVVYIYERTKKVSAENHALQIGHLKTQADQEQYKILEEQYDGQRILIHDIKNHLGVIIDLAQKDHADDVAEYTTKLLSLPVMAEKVRLCDSSVLNVILLRHRSFCKENGISFSCDVRSGAVSQLDDISITALFENVLKNAEESAIRSERKSLDISVEKRNPDASVWITVVNSCDEPPQTDADGRLISTKKGPGIHGVGWRSIESVIEKYDGIRTFYYNADAHEFHVIIRLGRCSQSISGSFRNERSDQS